MIYLDGFKLWIVGDGDIASSLKEEVIHNQLSEKVFFLGKLIPDKLDEITPKAMLGVSLEEDLGLNYRYALPNKIFDYIQAEVPILISDLTEMKAIVNNYNVGEIVNERNPKALANQIKKMVGKDFSLSLKTAKKELIWDAEETKLLKLFKKS